MTVLHAEMEKALAKVEASIQAAVDQLHRRVDTTRDLCATDIANVLSRLQEAEDGIVRHRDQLMQMVRAEVTDKIHELEARIRTLEVHAPQYQQPEVPKYHVVDPNPADLKAKP